MTTQPATAAEVWLVDDDEDDRFLVQSAFAPFTPPVSLKLLTDGQDVLPALQRVKRPPRLILMDINMPYQNGFDTLRQLRQQGAWQHLPIILFSTSSNPDDQRKAIELGATHFLTKPSEYSQMKGVVEQLVQDWQLAY